MVVRIGMRRVVRWALSGLLAMTFVFILTRTVLHLPPQSAFAMYVIWQTAVFFMAGLGIGNMNAIAMEPMGHIAGMAASIISALSTVAAVVLAAPVSLAFDGTPLPAAVGVFACSLTALFLIAMLRETAQQVDPDPTPGSG